MLVVKERQSGFTMMELLTVLAIISLLLGILVPSMNTVRKAAKNAKQGAQFAAIAVALTAFKSDDGDYPESELSSAGDYGGSQKLAEALVGWDLMGFHPRSTWDALGGVYDATDANNLDERRGFYIDRDKANAYWLGGSQGVFQDSSPLAAGTFVICDSFGKRKLQIGKKVVRAGAPILYYRANLANRAIDTDAGVAAADGTYDYRDNYNIVALGKVTSNGVDDGDPTDDHPNYTDYVDGTYDFSGSDKASFYHYIVDRVATEASSSMISGVWRSYNPETYLLISAGNDGEYGTADDITNFGD